MAFFISLLPTIARRARAVFSSGADRDGRPGRRHWYLSVREGIRDVLERCIVSRGWTAWSDDMAWLSVYFTLAVWASIALVHVPPLGAARR